jgi:GDP-L-fucose synthase
MDNYNEPEFINVGSDTEIKISDLANIIKDTIGFRGHIAWDTSLPNGTPRRKMDSNRLFNMGWKPKVSFEEGLKRTIEWYLNNKTK